MSRRILYIFLVVAAAGIAAWAVVHFKLVRRNQPAATVTNALQPANTYTWDQAVEKVKAERDESLGGAVETPPELKHYSERYWFLATQVAEVEKHKLQTCQDFLDLAAMIERGEMVPVPAVTNSYILFGVGQKADQDRFTRY